MRYVIRWGESGEHGVAAVEMRPGRWIRLGVAAGRVSTGSGGAIGRTDHYVDGTDANSIRRCAVLGRGLRHLWRDSAEACFGFESRYEDSHGVLTEDESE